MASAILAALIFGQIGFGQAALAVLSGLEDGCCSEGCPCDAVERTERAHTTHHADSPDACPAGDADLPCPPGCDECNCTLTAVVSLGWVRLAFVQVRPGHAASPPPTAARSAEVCSGVYRPPRTLIV
jgi:hypothetical protein